MGGGGGEKEGGGCDLRSENGTGDRDESAVNLRLAVRGGDDVAGGQEGDFGAGGDVAVCGWGDETGECLRRDTCGVSDDYSLQLSGRYKER